MSDIHDVDFLRNRIQRPETAAGERLDPIADAVAHFTQTPKIWKTTTAPMAIKVNALMVTLTVAVMMRLDKRLW